MAVGVSPGLVGTLSVGTLSVGTLPVGLVRALADLPWLPLLLTVLAFGAGLLVGWLWWGRQFLRARLTREEALSIMQGHLEHELAVTDARIAGLRAEAAGPGSPPPTGGDG